MTRPGDAVRDDPATGDRGSVVPFVAICLTIVVASAALAIDLGRLAVAGRESRTVADLAALDAVRVLDGSDTATQQPTVEAAAVRSAERNGFQPGVDGTLVVTLGVFDRSTRTFRATAAAEVPDAVQVAVHRDNDNVFAPGSFGVDRVAIASAGSQGVVGVALATTIVVDPEEALVLDALLTDVLGGPVDLTVTEWQALADATVDLEDLATTGAGLAPDQVQQLLDQTWSLGELIEALDRMPLPADAAAAVDRLLGLGTDPLTLRLADTVAVDLGDPDAHGLSIGVAELVRTAALLSAQGRTFPVTLDAGGLGVAAVTMAVHVVEAPGYAFGPVGTTVRSAQLRASVVATLADPVVVAGLEPAVATLPLVLDSGRAEAEVGATDCGAAAEPAEVDLAASTAAATVTVGQPAGSLSTPGTAPATIVELAAAPPAAPDPVARFEADVDLPLASGAAGLAFAAPYGWTPVQTVSSGGDPASALVVVPADLDPVDLGSPVPIATIAIAVANAVDAALPSLVVPLMRALGADLGAADVSVPAAACRHAQLVA